MIPRVALAVLFAILMILPLSTRACAVGFKPETSGFALNPTLNKLTVTSSKPEKPGDLCLLHVNDEILQVNSQLVPGARALSVMRYWKAIPDGSAITFVVRRDGAVTKVTTK
jgi:hypothetical protein